MKNQKQIIELAKAIAAQAHAGQKRKFEESNLPYIIHPQRVAASVEDKLKPIAWLHDTLEDTPLTETYLREYFSGNIVDAVVDLTRKKGENYFDFIMRIMQNEQAMFVKIADIEDNLKSLPEGSLKDKYRLAKYVLYTSIVRRTK